MSRTHIRKNMSSYWQYGSRAHYIGTLESQALRDAHWHVRYFGDDGFEKAYWDNFNSAADPRRWYKFHRYARGFTAGHYFRNRCTVRPDRTDMRNDLANVYRDWEYEVVSHSAKKKAGYWN